ncbi:hypothetical protein D3C72_853840 [compost metagenome]
MVKNIVQSTRFVVIFFFFFVTFDLFVFSLPSDGFDLESLDDGLLLFVDMVLY